MTLEDLAYKLANHIQFKRDDSGDPVNGGIWFSRMQNPAALVLPSNGLPLGAIVGFLQDIIGDYVDISAIPDVKKIQALQDLRLTRFEVEIADPIAESDVFVSFGMKPGKENGWHLGDHVGLGGALVVSDATLDISRVGLFDEIEFDISGTLEIWKSLIFAVAYQSAGNSISAEYAGDPIHLGKLFDSMGMAAFGIDGEIDVLAVQADLPVGDQKGETSDYQVDVAVSKIECGGMDFPIRSANLNITRQGGMTATTVDVIITVMDHDIIVSGHKQDDGVVFKGHLDDQGLNVGEAIEKLTQEVSKVHVPAALSSLRITALSVEIDTSSGLKSFHIETKFSEGGMDIAVSLTLSINKEKNSDLTFILKIGPTTFAMIKHKEGTEANVADDEGKVPADVFAVTYVPADDTKFGIKDDLVAHLTNDQDVIDLVPALKIGLDGAIFSQFDVPKRPDNEAEYKSKVIGIGLNTGDGLDISKLPLLGDVMKTFGASGSLGINDAQIFMATEAVVADDISQLNTMLSDVDGAMQITQAKVDGADAGLNKGFNLSGQFNLGIETLDVSAGSSGKAAQDPDVPPAKDVKHPNATSALPAPYQDAHWFSIQKKIGPLYLDKLGVSYSSGELWVIPDASMTMAGLTISLEGFAVSTPLDHFSPSFHLQGLGVDFKTGPVEIGGAFMRVEPTKEQPYESFYGTVVVQTEAFSLSAMGAYARVNEEPSMFVYLELDYPLGGPPYFFVTGLALGFGYNRALNIPSIDELESFPLIQTVGTGSSGSDDSVDDKVDGEKGGKHSVAEIQGSLTTKLENMKKYIPVESGQQWLAAGVHFTSFEIVDAFALLTIAFGNRFEAHLLGRAVYCYPPGSDKTGNPLTKIDVLIDAAYLPEQGVFELTAKLADGSYVFEPDCHLTGGLAFRSWFKGPHKDEFIFTLGGYNSKFHVPAFYPSVDRLEFNWKKGDNLVIKGGMYFAMSGHALMVGGFLDATWESGALKAWLKITADFMIAYKPFHYDAEMSIDIGAEVTIHFFGTHHLSVHLGADLHIWGPSFSGTASFDIWVASFSVSFGDGSQKPPALTWDEFTTSFLSKTAPMISTSVLSGLVQDLDGYMMTDAYEVVPSQEKDAHHWLINAKHFLVSTAFQVPIRMKTNDGEDTPTFGIKPMQLAVGDIVSEPQVVIWHESEPQPITHEHFAVEPTFQNVPSGLWGEAEVNDVHAKSSVAGIVNGQIIKPKHPPVSDETMPIERGNLAFETETMTGAFEWSEIPSGFGKDWVLLGRTWASPKAEADFEDTATTKPVRDDFFECIFDKTTRDTFDGALHGAALMLGWAENIEQEGQV